MLCLQPPIRVLETPQMIPFGGPDINDILETRTEIAGAGPRGVGAGPRGVASVHPSHFYRNMNASNK